jgi:hypothetical protein
LLHSLTACALGSTHHIVSTCIALCAWQHALQRLQRASRIFSAWSAKHTLCLSRDNPLAPRGPWTTALLAWGWMMRSFRSL